MRKMLLILSVVAVGLLFAGIASAQSFHANIDGFQPVPPTFSPGTGLGCFTVGPAPLYTLQYNISFSGLLAAETVAHIHGPAPIGINAGVQIPLPLGSPKIGSVNLTFLQFVDLVSGLYYVNIHSALFPGGEIRGQILTGSCPPVPTEQSTWGAIKGLYNVQ